MEMIAGAGAGLVRAHCYSSSGIDLGRGRCCALKSRKSSFSSCSGYDLFSKLLSIGDSQFPLKSSSTTRNGAARPISGATATGNGAFTGGSRAEDINEKLSTVLPHSDGAAFRAVLAAIASVALAQKREEAPPVKSEMPVDALREGRLVESRLVYRQTFVIRSYEIGADRTASIETVMNHFQESHLGSHPNASSRRAISCVGDVIETDTWVAASGKNAMCRDWLARDYKTGQILARATSTWVMMNRKTRKLSKMPEEVRAEVSPYFLSRSAITDESLLTQKIIRLNGNAQYVRSGLTPRRSDLDMNQHVNNVKYIGWMMESVPPEVLDGYELANMSLEYRRECGQSDVVQSMTSLEPSTSESSESQAGSPESNGTCKSHSLSHAAAAAAAPSAAGAEMKHTVASEAGYLQLVHLLRMENDGAEIVRGRTQWRPKNVPSSL